MLVRGGSPRENLQRAALRIEEAARLGAQVAVLPEAVDLGWTHPDSKTMAESIPDGWACRQLAEAARASKVHVCAGLVERETARIYNSAVLIDPEGRVILKHRKLNELEIGQEYYSQGDRLGVVETPLGRVGLMICADAFASGQVVTRTLGLMGADLILSPCAWAVPADHDPERDPYGELWERNYGPPAADFRLWIVGISNVGPIEAGPWAGRKCIGNSMIVGPDGTVVRRGGYGEEADEIILCDLETEVRPAQGAGWEAFWETERPAGVKA